MRNPNIGFLTVRIVDIVFLRIFVPELGMQNGVAYVKVFVGILRDISKQETVEYMLAMVDEMLTGTLLKNTRS